jgi:hypothetical protein
MRKLLLELAGCGLVAAGLAMFSVPVALIAAGAAVVAACEVRG